jgi:hypothetical protein
MMKEIVANSFLIDDVYFMINIVYDVFEYDYDFYDEV